MARGGLSLCQQVFGDEHSVTGRNFWMKPRHESDLTPLTACGILKSCSCVTGRIRKEQQGTSDHRKEFH